MVKYFISNGDKVERLTGFAPRCWVDMVNPTDDECEDVAQFSGIPEDMIKAALDEEERARFEFDEGASMFVVDCPIIEENDGGDSYTTLPLAVIYNEKCILTVCLKGNTVLKDFITGREKVLCDKPLHFLLSFMLGNAKRFLYCLKQIDRKNHRIQSELGKAMKNAEIINLLDLENSLVYFSTSLHSNDRVHDKVSKLAAVTANEDLHDLLDDVLIESRQAMEMCNIYKNILTVTMDAYGSVISNNANNNMQKLTIITIILAIPTMIAGFWGMNMPVPGQDGYAPSSWVWFFVAIGATVVLTCALAVVIMKLSGYQIFSKRIRHGKKRKKDKK